MDEGRSAREVAAEMRLMAKTVREIGRRYEAGVWSKHSATSRGPAAVTVFDDSQQQRIIAMVCSEPAKAAPISHIANNKQTFCASFLSCITPENGFFSHETDGAHVSPRQIAWRPPWPWRKPASR